MKHRWIALIIFTTIITTSLGNLKLVGAHITSSPINPPIVVDFADWQVDTELRKTILEKLNSLYNGSSTTQLYLSYYDERGDWAFISFIDVTHLDTKAQEDFPLPSIPFLAHRLPNEQWLLEQKGTIAYSILLNESPEWFVSSKAKNSLDPLVTDKISQMHQQATYKLPWDASQNAWWRVGLDGWHQGYSLDFQPSFHRDANRTAWVLSASTGTVSDIQICGKTANVEINHADGAIQYVHLDKNSLRVQKGDEVSTGTWIGNLYCSGNPCSGFNDGACGWGTARHIHISFPSSDLIVDGRITQEYANMAFGASVNSSNQRITDSIPPSKASNVRPNGWVGPYTTDTTPGFAWDAATDGESGMAGYYVAVDDWTPEGTYGNDWWVGNVTSYQVPTVLSDGEHIFAVTSKDNAGNTNPTNTNQQGDAPYYTFYVDTTAPTAPQIAVSGAGCSAIQNNGWQNTCREPTFSWTASDSVAGIKDYRYYWGESPSGTPDTLTTETTFSPGVIAPVDSVVTMTLNVTARDMLDHESARGSFTLRYDALPPTVTLLINNGSDTASQVNVTLNLSAGDVGSGVSEVCISGSPTCDNWQAYADSLPWTLPALNMREQTLYAQVRDRAGNTSAVVSDTITLDLYPVMPHSANYRICDDVVNAAGSAGITSTSFSLVSSVGQPWTTGASANDSASYLEHSGFLAATTGCRPISYTVTSNFTVTQWVIAAGGSLRGSTNYRLGDTAGQPAASGTTALTSTSYTLSSGFWAQITGTVPSTSTIVPTPPPPTPTPTPTPGPTPTPQPGGFGVSINDGALYTNDANVTVETWAPNVTHVRLSDDGGYTDTNWQSYQTTHSWALPVYGNYVMPRTVYVWFKDAQGTVYGAYQDDIIYDPVAPQGSVTVLDSSPTTMTLQLEAYDYSGIAHMRIAESRITEAPWQPYATTKTVTRSGESAITYVQFQDNAGNDSPIYGSDGSQYDLAQRPVALNLYGPMDNFIDTACYIAASVEPYTTTLPLTYIWQASDYETVTHT
jgi:hypothetical protein